MSEIPSHVEIQVPEPEITLEPGEAMATKKQLFEAMPEMFSAKPFIQDIQTLLRGYSEKLKAMAGVYDDHDVVKRLRESGEVVVGSLYGFLRYDCPIQVDVSDRADGEPGVYSRRKVQSTVVETQEFKYGLIRVLGAAEGYEMVFGLMDHLVELIEKIDQYEDDYRQSQAFEEKYRQQLDAKLLTIQEPGMPMNAPMRTQLETAAHQIKGDMQREMGKQKHAKDRKKRAEDQLNVLTALIDRYFNKATQIPMIALFQQYSIPEAHVGQIRADANNMDIRGGIGDIFKQKKTRSYIAYNKDLEASIQAEKDRKVKEYNAREKRRQVRTLLQRAGLALALGGGGIALYTEFKSDISESNAQPAKVASTSARSSVEVTQEVAQQISFVKRNISSSLRHTGQLNPELERRIAEAHSINEVEGAVFGFYQEAWFESSYDPTFNHVGFKVNPDFKKIVVAMYGRESKINIYSERKSDPASGSASYEVSYLKDLLCDGIRLGLKVQAHDADEGAVHWLNDEVKKKMYCR